MGELTSRRPGGRYLVRSLGCKANFVDGQILEKELQLRGWVPAREKEEADLCIVNSCTVTDEADRQSRRLASKLSRENPGARVVFTGCGAEVAPASLSSVRGVDFVVGNSDKPRAVNLVLEALAREEPRKAGEILGGVRNYEQMASRHPMDREWPSAEARFPRGLRLEEGNTLRTRGFLKIQDGCNSFCTYCIIPYGRGPSRSQKPEEIVEQVRGLVEAGIREVVLTGTNIGDYGADWGEPLPNGVHLERLVEMLLEMTSIERIRTSSLDPTELRPGLVSLSRQSGGRLCPHFHISLQSPHSRVLRAMKRRYTKVEVERCLETIASEVPGAFVGMDLIAGFPGESAEEFRESFETLEHLPWSRLHVFPYSEREGTPATRLAGMLPMQERRRRASEWLALSRSRLRSHYERRLRESTGMFEGVLLERPVRLTGADGRERTWHPGYTPDYLRLLIPEELGRNLARNQLLRVRAAVVVEDSGNQEFALEVAEIMGN